MWAFKYTSAFLTGVAYVGLAATGLVAAAQTPSAPAASRTAAVRTFDSAKHAADAVHQECLPRTDAHTARTTQSRCHR